MQTAMRILTGLAFLALSACATASAPAEEPASNEEASSVLQPPSPEALSEEMRAVESAVDRFGRMWEDEDMNTFDALIAHDADMVIVGTDTAEYIVGYEAFRRARQEQFDSFDNVEYNVEDRDIKLSEMGNTAWFTQRFDLFTLTEGGPVSLEDLRLTGVLEKRDGQWRIVQLHTSVPVAGQAAEY